MRREGTGEIPLLCPTLAPGTELVVNLSGRGDKDVNTVAEKLGGALGG
jgi:tryptophan synthase beta chain